MKKQDQTRENISKAKGSEKVTLLNQYKKLRNNVTSQLSKENIEFNNNRLVSINFYLLYKSVSSLKIFE